MTRVFPFLSLPCPAVCCPARREVGERGVPVGQDAGGLSAHDEWRGEVQGGAGLFVDRVTPPAACTASPNSTQDAAVAQ